MPDLVDNIDQAPPTATLGDLLARFRRNIELDLRVAAPATVVTYNPATGTATVTLGALPVKYVKGVAVPQPPIVIPDIQVAFPGGSLGYVTTGLVPGDTGHVTFTDRCLEIWKTTGLPSDPINGRTHNLADAFFTPGLRPVPRTIVPAANPLATVVEGPPVAGILLGRLALQPVLQGGVVIAAIAAVTAAEVIYATAVANAYATWIGSPPAPPTVATNGAFIGALGAAQATRAAAYAQLTLTLPDWPSPKVFTE